MTDLRADVRTAAEARRAAFTCNGTTQHAPPPSEAPNGAARMLPFPAQMRAKLVDHKGKKMYQVDGYATVYNKPYDMWDMFGPYTEKVNDKASEDTLAANPDVAFLTNHKGVTMARTTNGSLTLGTDQHGLPVQAFLNPDRADVQILMSAIDDKLVTEMSFAFMLTRGLWNDDFDEFEIMEFDIDRGDVSAVNYGANPYTSIGARSRELITYDLDHLSTGVARAALQRLQGREDLRAGPMTRAALDAVTASLARAVGWFTDIGSIVDEAHSALAPTEDTAPTDPSELTPPDDELREPAPLEHPSLALDGRSTDALAAFLQAAEVDKYGVHP